MSIAEFFASSPAGFIITAFVFGSIVGSFLNVVIYRLPVMLKRDWRQQCETFLADENTPMEEGHLAREDKGEVFNLVTPRSRCPHCGTPIRARDNIPMFGWLLLRGRCRQCKEPISVRYPIIELVTGLLTAFAAWHFGFGWQFLMFAILTWCLVVLTMIDYDTQLLPDDITLPLMWLGLLYSFYNPVVTPKESIIGAAAGYLVLWAVYHVFRLLTGKEGMGYGDFKLLAVFGAWLGYAMLPLIIILSALVGAILGIGMIIFLGRDRNVPIPFGPYLAAAGLVAVYWGDAIIKAYFSFAGMGTTPPPVL